MGDGKVTTSVKKGDPSLPELPTATDQCPFMPRYLPRRLAEQRAGLLGAHVVKVPVELPGLSLVGARLPIPVERLLLDVLEHHAAEDLGPQRIRDGLQDHFAFGELARQRDVASLIIHPGLPPQLRGGVIDRVAPTDKAAHLEVLFDDFGVENLRDAIGCLGLRALTGGIVGIAAALPVAEPEIELLGWVWGGLGE